MTDLSKFSNHDLALLIMGHEMELSAIDDNADRDTGGIDLMTGEPLPTKEELELEVARFTAELLRRNGKLN